VGSSGKRFHLSLSNSFAAKFNKSGEFSIGPSLFNEGFQRGNSTLSNYGYERTESDKEEKKRKINTVKSLGGSRYLNNSKYL
jgi:hypothetical protein